MKVCLKRKVITDGKTFLKHQEGHVIGITWKDKEEFEYFIDFPGIGIYSIKSSDFDILDI